MINEEMARQSQVEMRTRRPMDGRVKAMMERISHGLKRTGWPQLETSSLRMVAHRHLQLKGARR